MLHGLISGTTDLSSNPTNLFGERLSKDEVTSGLVGFCKQFQKTFTVSFYRETLNLKIFADILSEEHYQEMMKRGKEASDYYLRIMDD